MADAKPEPAPSLDEAMQQTNRLVMARIDAQLRGGFGAALHGGDFCVVRSSVTGVMSVLASAKAGDRGDALFGPGTFADCIEFVNSTVVARMADSDGLEPAAAPAPAAPSDPQEAQP